MTDLVGLFSETNANKFVMRLPQLINGLLIFLLVLPTALTACRADSSPATASPKRLLTASEAILHFLNLE